MNLPTDGLAQLVNYGALGVMDVLLIFAVVFLYKENKSLSKTVLDISEKSKEAIVEPLKNLQSQGQAMLTILENLSKK